MRHRWSEQDDRILLETVAEFGPDRSRLAASLGLPYNAVNGRTQALGQRYHDAVESYFARSRAQREVAPPTQSRFSQVLDVPVRPFEVGFPKITKSEKGKKWTTAVIKGDTHYPFQDKKALSVVFGVIKDARPDVIVDVGDLVDCWQISRFDKDPSRLDTLQENIDEAREHLAHISHIAPKARKYWLEGNHESRLARSIWKLDGAQRELARLRIFQQAMTWPALMDSASIGWTFVPEREQSRTEILPKIIAKHGQVVRKWSGASAKGEWERYGKSGVSGHTHRLGWFTHRDHNGLAQWIETGCTCLLESPYGVDFDWAQGLVVLTWNRDYRLQQTEFVSIRDGSALWRTQEYKAKKAA